MQDEVTQALPPEVQLIVDEVTAKFRQELQQIMAKDEYTCLITGKAIEPWARQFLARHRHQAERDTLARMELVAWSYTVHTPDGPKTALTFAKRTHYDGYPVTHERALYALPPAPEAGQ